MMLTQTSDADPVIVCAIPDHPGDLDPRTIEAAYEDDAHYLGTLPAEYHLDIEQHELTKHPSAVDQVNALLATLGFAPVQPFTAIAWTNRHEQPVVLVVAQQSRLSNVNVLGCSDEVAVTLDEVEVVQQQVLNLLEQRVEHAASTAAQGEAARTEAQMAFDQARGYFNDGPGMSRLYDDTWDAFALARTGNPGASARSIVITYLRELEDERTRVENLAAESQP